MRFAHLKRNIEFDTYDLIEESDASIFTLANFLRLEINGNHPYNYFTDWLIGKFKQDFAEGNTMRLQECADSDTIYIYSMFDSEDKRLRFYTTKQKMLDILYSWAMTVSKDPAPQEIMITEENGEVEISVVN